MNRAFVVGLALGAAAVSFAGTANASTFTNLFSTGVDVVGGIDQAWSIVGGSSNPALSYPSNAYTNATNGVFPINGYWVPNTPQSSWDTPFNPLNSNTDPAVNGSYIYQTTFTANAAALLSFQFAADNEVAWITVNGNQIYTGPNDGSSQDNAFLPLATILSAPGSYTLQFDVINYAQQGGNPSGLNVQFANGSSVPTTPLPSTWMMMLGGLIAFGYMALRRRKSDTIGAAA